MNGEERYDVVIIERRQAVFAFYLCHMGFRWSPVRIRPPRLLRLKLPNRVERRETTCLPGMCRAWWAVLYDR